MVISQLRDEFKVRQAASDWVLPRAWIRPIVPSMDYGASILLMANIRPDLGERYRTGARLSDALGRRRVSTSRAQYA